MFAFSTFIRSLGLRSDLPHGSSSVRSCFGWATPRATSACAIGISLARLPVPQGRPKWMWDTPGLSNTSHKTPSPASVVRSASILLASGWWSEPDQSTATAVKPISASLLLSLAQPAQTSTAIRLPDFGEVPSPARASAAPPLPQAAADCCGAGWGVTGATDVGAGAGAVRLLLLISLLRTAAGTGGSCRSEFRLAVASWAHAGITPLADDSA